MFNYKHFLAKLMLAAAMIGVGGQAAAAPIFKVAIDTASLGTGSAFLGLYFAGLAGAADATATVTGLSGALDGDAALFGSVTGSGNGSFVFANANGGGELVQAIQLGGQFNFDVSFTADPGLTGTTFGWALFDTVQYLGVDGDLGNLFLQPSAPVGEQIIIAAPNTQLGGVTVVPEPSTAALMVMAMLVLLAMSRKGARRF